MCGKQKKNEIDEFLLRYTGDGGKTIMADFHVLGESARKSAFFVNGGNKIKGDRTCGFKKK